MLETLLGAILIFAMRVVDVSIGTMRMIILMRGRVGLAAAMGFFESLTWVIAASVVFSNLGDPLRVVAFAAGFGMGVLVGGLVERRIAMGNAFVRIVAPYDTPEVAPLLRLEGYPVTVLNAEGRDGEVRLSFLVIPRRKIKEALSVIEAVNPDAFITVEEVHLPELERTRRAATVRK